MMNERWLPYPGAPTQWFSQPWPQTTTNGMTQPAFLLQPFGTAPSTTWYAGGTGFGINAPAGFAGYLMDLRTNGASAFSVDSAGNIYLGTGNIICKSGTAGSITLSFTQMSLGGSNGGVNISTNQSYAAMISNAQAYAWTNVGNNYTALATALYTDGSGQVAQRNGTNAQRLHVYDTYTNSTDYHRVAIATARATLSSVSGASVTATNLIPAGAVVVGVTSKVTTGLGTSNGTTGYQVGTAASANRWGSITGTAAGTSTDNRNWTTGTIECFTAATSVIITANGGNFNGTGVIYVSVQYLTGESD